MDAGIEPPEDDQFDQPVISGESRSQTDTGTYPWKPWNIRHVGSGGNEQFHCVPLDDLKPHIYSQACECNVVEDGLRMTKYGRLLPMFVHSSWDWRELEEMMYFGLHGSEVDNELLD